MIELQELDFLVHPGFTLDFNEKRGTIRLTSQEERAYCVLFDKYQKRIANLEHGEAVVVLSHLKVEDFARRDAKGNLYTEKIAELDDLLRDTGRGLLVTDDNSPFIDPRRTYAEINERFRRLRFEITRETKTYGYGERLNVCVPMVSQALNTAGGFNEATKILTDLTDMAVAPRDREATKELLGRYDRISVVF